MSGTSQWSSAPPQEPPTIWGWLWATCVTSSLCWSAIAGQAAEWLQNPWQKRVQPAWGTLHTAGMRFLKVGDPVWPYCLHQVNALYANRSGSSDRNRCWHKAAFVCSWKANILFCCCCCWMKLICLTIVALCVSILRLYFQLLVKLLFSPSCFTVSMEGLGLHMLLCRVAVNQVKCSLHLSLLLLDFFLFLWYSLTFWFTILKLSTSAHTVIPSGQKVKHKPFFLASPFLSKLVSYDPLHDFSAYFPHRGLLLDRA